MDEASNDDFNLTQTASLVGAVPNKKSEGILPVLLRQLHESAENSLTLFGKSFGMVVCVAIVRSIEQTSTKITYSLEDWTGRIEANYWINDGDDAGNISIGIFPNKYVRVFGCLRAQFDKKTIMILHLSKINDPNEILTHNLEMLQARFKAEHYSKQHAADDCKTVQPLDIGVSSGFNPKHRLVYEAICERRNQDGISRQELREKFKHMSERELALILDSLIAEGHIYSSIDSDHFCNTT